MKDLALPAPGTIEPEQKPSKERGRLGEKPVLPPPKKDLTQDAVENAAKQAAAAAAAAEIPMITEAPPPDLRVEREPQRPAPMKRERSKSKSAKIKVSKPAAKKPKRAPAMFDDDEVAIVARDPRRSREE